VKKMAGREACMMEAMEAYFGDDIKRIRHAHKVTDYAEELLRKEGGDREVVIAAAILHDIGAKAPG
jgi:HD superfamily phosphodiesterase